MPPPQKGKVPTKGAKQILMENTATINFYRNMALGAGLFHIILLLTLYWDSLIMLTFCLNILVIIVNTLCYQVMKSMTRPRYGVAEGPSTNPPLLDAGLDLNMEGGMGEHIKDVVILTSITQVLAAVSNWFWLLLLLCPLRAFWILWKNILGPWFFQENLEAEQDEKRKKKQDRKMKRYQQ